MKKCHILKKGTNYVISQLVDKHFISLDCNYVNIVNHKNQHLSVEFLKRTK